MTVYPKPSELNASFGRAISNAFKYCWHYTGRSSRSEYWWFYLFELLIGIPTLGIGLLVCLFPALSLTIRRLHDSGRSGWNYLWCFLPIVGGLIVFIMLLMDSEHCENKYGGFKESNYTSPQPPVHAPKVPAAPVHTPQPPVMTNSVSAELTRLASLYQQGLITQQEYETLKTRVIYGN